ncbi:hypothetical protein Oweho_0394 [Owenweeksia hongkongensis DSM 17368]|uniref:DUF5723 domain-containing protein n=1 Tax=Owenweeksia hongkongensis (strain DSM 17368 / CIP 108786 / JCM 12287 / NRRL B-23963 / UST20020801) TaxID=926562 RepID=G8R8N1_OWEHD|nr:DUF5723 family protein [Owenweeksia hongkongensis]AEV31413.1 hypothetical protein Oweho_0394 [Owenweeksia hongkongensis DSM 17368]
MKKLILFASALVGFSTHSFAQSDLTLYNFNSVAQSLHVNPALPQQTRVWVGIPLLSSIQVSYHNDGFRPIDLFETGTDVNENLDNIILGLDDESQFAINQSIDLLGVGFQVSGGFLTLGAQQVTDYRMDYPVDLLRLVRFGNAGADYRSSNVSEFDFETVTRTNYYIGYQKDVNDKLSLGGRFKYIIGQGHAYVEKMDATIETLDNSNLEIETDIIIRTAGISDYIEENPFEIKTSVFPDNNGFGIDLGANYVLDDKWSFSASVLDLGFINWKSGTRDYVSKGTFEYEGVDANLNDDDPVGSFDEILDSLAAAFEFTEVDGEKYTKWLASRVFLAANYKINERHTFGAVYQMKLWSGTTYHDFSVNYQGRLARAFQYTVSYSIINGTYNNVGAGFQTKLGPVQLYLLTDNFLNIMYYENLETTNVRLGLNVALFDKKTKKNKTKAPTNVEDALEPVKLENQ